MSIFEDNMAYLEKFSCGLHQQIRQKLEEIKPSRIKANICRNKRDELNIKVDDGTREYFVHSTYNVDAEAAKWTEGVDTQADIIVIIGLGLGYHVEKLRGMAKKEAKIFVIEPSMEIFKLFIENRRFSEVFTGGNFSLIIGELSENSARQIFAGFKEVLLGKVEFAAFSIYRSLYGEHFETIKKEFLDYIRVFSKNISTTEYFKWLWLKNHLMNILHMDGVVNGKHLSGKFKGKPAIIVSAGPSLNKNIRLLEHAKNKAVIFAAGSSFRVLKNHGITPDFTVAIDGSPLIKDIYHDLDTNGTILLYMNRINDETLRLFQSKKAIFIDNEDRLARQFAEIIGIDFEIMEPDQTVAGTCVSMASFMGCSPIVLIGQDFACTNLEFHAEGAAHMKNFREDLEKDKNELILMKDIFGQDTYTLPNLLSARISMEARVWNGVKEGNRFINATEGGIGVKNCVNMAFADVLQKHLNHTLNIKGAIHEIINDTRYLVKIDRDKLRLYFEYIDLEARLLKSKAMALNDLCEKAKKELSNKTVYPEQYANLAKNINEAQSSIEKNEFYSKIILAAITQSIAIHKLVMENDIKNTSDIIEKNLHRIKFISKQMTEICEVCVFLESFIQNVYNPLYKNEPQCEGV